MQRVEVREMALHPGYPTLADCMMRTYRLVVWGHEIFAWEIDGALEVRVTTDAEDEDDSEITGGSGGLFERDGNPPDPMREEPRYEDRKSFGFGNG